MISLSLRKRCAALLPALFIGLPAPAKDVYVIPSSHLDLWYLGTPDNAYARFERILSGALDLLDREPDFRYTIENAYFLTQYLRLRPEMHDRLRAGFAGRRLDLSAQWCGLLQNPATAEDLVRNVQLAADLARREFHFKPRAILADDMPGFTPQIAQLWHRSGVDGAMLTRGGPKETPIFFWKAPDGSTSRIAYTVGGYATAYLAGLANSIETAEATAPVVTFHSVRNKKQEYNTGLIKYVNQNYPGDGPAILGAAPDLSFPSAALAPVAAEWNRRHGAQIRVHVETMPEFLDATRGGSFPTLSGDLQSVWQPASLNVERHLTLARTGHQLLVAEKLATLASLITPMRYPAEALDRAWGWHLEALDHEGAAVPDFPARAQRVATDVQTLAAQMIASRTRTANRNAMVVAVINPVGWSRHALLRVPLFLHGDIPSDARRWRQVVIHDEQGKTVPARLREMPPHAVAKTAELTVELDLPPLGYRAVTLDPADDRTGPDVTPWEAPEWKPAVSQPAIAEPGGWQAGFEAPAQSVLLSHAKQPVARIAVLAQAKPIAWKTVKRMDRWKESILRLEGREGDAQIAMELHLRDGQAPELVNDVVYPGDYRGRILLRVSPVRWTPQSVVYGVPFGEMPFGSKVPGTGPTLPGDERPLDLWRTLKEFDGWFRWDAAAGRVVMATEARGAQFAADGVSFTLAPRSRSLDESGTPHLSMHSSFDFSPKDPAARLMWELMERPVAAVSEDRFGPATLGGSFSLLDWSAGNVIVTALKRSADGSVVLRSYAHSDSGVTARLRTYRAPTSLTELTPIEEAIGNTDVNRKFGPWEIRTLRLWGGL